MAKNNYKMNVNQYSNQAEQIRKAKGNPNKNIHAKKKNSNYGGYSAGSYMAQKIVDKANQQERVKLPTWLNVTLGVEFAAVLIVLIRKYKHTKKNSGLYTVITIVLVIMCLLYTTFGVLGLLGFLG